MREGDKRRTVRVPKRIELRYSSNSPPMNGFIEDLGEGGMFVDSPQPLPAGSEVEFWFDLPDAAVEQPIHGHGKVVWSAPTGMGVEFRSLGDEERERIRFFVASVLFGQS